MELAMKTMTRTKESKTTTMAMNDDEEADNDEAEIFQNVSSVLKDNNRDKI